MTETGAGTGRRKKLAAAAIVAVLIVAGAWAVLRSGTEHENGRVYYTFYLDAEYGAEAAVVRIIDIQKNNGDSVAIPPDEVHYHTTYTGYELVSTIADEPDGYGLRWLDADEDGMVGPRDWIKVDWGGGADGALKPHDEVGILRKGIGGEKVYLPPAEFLDMDVQKTSTGWNMTVTWVNESVPEAFMSGSNVSFRIENESGAFGTWFGIGSGKIGWSIPIAMIDNNYVAEPGAYDAHNNTYYLLDWYDNDINERLSVNDTIVIKYFSDSEEKLSFRLFCNKYGWRHAMFEVTLP